MTDMLVQVPQHPPSHTDEHFHDLSKTQIYPSEDTPLRWKCSTSTSFAVNKWFPDSCKEKNIVFFRDFFLFELSFLEVLKSKSEISEPAPAGEKSLHNGREMVIWSNGAILSYRIPKHQTFSIIFLVRFCLFVGSCHPVCEKSARKKHMKKQFFALHKCSAIMFPKKPLVTSPYCNIAHDDKLKSLEQDLKTRGSAIQLDIQSNHRSFNGSKWCFSDIHQFSTPFWCRTNIAHSVNLRMQLSSHPLRTCHADIFWVSKKNGSSGKFWANTHTYKHIPPSWIDELPPWTKKFNLNLHVKQNRGTSHSSCQPNVSDV